MRQIALDTETTGLYTKNGDRIIEIGCVEIIDRNITGKIFHTYCNPGIKVSQSTIDITGIQDEFLLDKPKFADIVSEFLDFIKGAELIIHNAVFDVGFINYELSLLSHSIDDIAKHCSILDTLGLARSMYPGQRNNLDALIKRYNIEVDRKYHGALLDASILAQLALKMTSGQIGLNFDDFASKTNNESKMVNIELDLKTTHFKTDLKVVYADFEETNLHLKYIQELADS